MVEKREAITVRYVKRMDEQFWSEMLIEMIEAYENRIDALSMLNAGFIKGLAKLKPIRSPDDGKLYPFPIAIEMRRLYLFMTGQGALPDDAMDDTIMDLIALVWDNSFIPQPTVGDIQWNRWTTRLGYFVKCAIIVEKLQTNTSVNTSELATLAGISQVAVTKHILAKKLPATRCQRQWQITAPDATQWLAAMT